MISMTKKIVGGVIAVAIGGTTYTISQSDIASNFSKNTGMSQQQAQQYINNIPQSQLTSFFKVGQSTVSDGQSVIRTSSKIDCSNYTYPWQTFSLDCTEGANELSKIGYDEVDLGNCYQALDTNLGNAAKTKMEECISEIDKVDSDYQLPIVSAVLDRGVITSATNTNVYNKSVLEAALKSN